MLDLFTFWKRLDRAFPSFEVQLKIYKFKTPMIEIWFVLDSGKLWRQVIAYPMLQLMTEEEPLIEELIQQMQEVIRKEHHIHVHDGKYSGLSTRAKTDPEAPRSSVEIRRPENRLPSAGGPNAT